MLVVTRRVGEKVHIGDDITITLIKAGANTKIGIEAPKDIRVMRDNAKQQMPKPQEEQGPSRSACSGSIAG